MRGVELCFVRGSERKNRFEYLKQNADTHPRAYIAFVYDEAGYPISCDDYPQSCSRLARNVNSSEPF